MIYYGCELPEDLYYDVEDDVWLRFEDDGTVTMGMTDPAQTRCGKLVNIRIKKVGRTVKRGKHAAVIESGKWVGPFPSPLTGEIVANNRAGFEEDILVANKDPYGAGWIVRLRPSNLDEERNDLLAGQEALEAYQTKIDEHEIRCFRCED